MQAWLDGIRTHSWGKDGGSYTGGPFKGVLHTTETSVWPSYSSGDMAPHLSLMPKVAERIVSVRQHIPLDRAARAMRNEAGGVQTNRDSAVQLELIGTCNPAWSGRPGYYYWPDADDWALDALAAIMRRLEAQLRIPRRAVGLWPAYPSSYGKTARQRMSLSQWDAYSGWCGHMHVPENTHGDPGNMPIVRLMQPNAVIVPPAKVPVARPPRTAKAPPFPLPRGHYFGPKAGPAHSHSGYHGATDRNHLRTWQAQMLRRGWGLAVDGLYGPNTAEITRLFQREKGIGVDGLIGPTTWGAAWEAKVT